MPGKDIVVDTCVASSAGNKLEAPHSRSSREVLYAIRDHAGHKLVFNTALAKEWRNHAGRLAVSLLTSMVHRRRVKYVPDDAFTGVMRNCAQFFVNEQTRAAFEKDAHVVAAALASDRIIVSNEVRLKDQIVHLSDRRDEIKGIIWANPWQEGDSCAVWVRAGAQADSGRTLGG